MANFVLSLAQLSPNLYILFVRSTLEQSATVWHSSLTQENIEELERAKKSATKTILNDIEMPYEKRLALGRKPFPLEGRHCA